MGFFGEFEGVFFLWNDADDFLHVVFPVVEDFLRAGGAREFEVFLDLGFDFGDMVFAADLEWDNHLGVDARLELAVDVVNVSGSARHACTEVLSRAPEDRDQAVRHVFATVVTCAFNDRGGTGVPHREALTGLAVDVNY